MSLLDELRDIDLTEIINAKNAITQSIDNPGIKALLNTSAAETALADLGQAVEVIRTNISEPRALLEPLAEGLTGLGDSLDFDQSGLTDLLDQIKAGVALVKQLVGALNGDSENFASIFGFTGENFVNQVTSALEGYSEITLGDVGKFRSLVNVVERGFPDDPEAFAELSIEILLPLPKGSILDVRKGIDELLRIGEDFSLPGGRVSGLLNAFDKVTLAANQADFAAFKTAVQNLERVRLNTISSIGNDLRALAQGISQLRFDATLNPLLQTIQHLQPATDGIFEFLDELRVIFAHGRELLADFDPAEGVAILNALMDFIEQTAEGLIAEPVDQQVERLKEFIRSLFRELPLRDIREGLRRQFTDIARAVEDAEIDRFAEDIRGILDPVHEALESVDLDDKIRAVLQDAAGKIEDALASIESAIDTIKNQIDALAAQVVEILERGAEVVAIFKTQIDEITAAVDNLGIEETAQLVIQKITDLRETAEDLLNNQPLPEPLRPLVEQLIKEVESIDLQEVLLGPVRDALGEFSLNDTVRQPLVDGLAAMRDILDNLIPAKLIEDIQKEISDALDVLSEFDPTILLGKVGEYINGAADLLTELDPQDLVDEIRRPFLALLELVDALHPDVVLKPVYDLYDSLLDEISISPTDVGIGRINNLFEGLGNSLRETVLTPVTELSGSAGADIKEAGQTAPERDNTRIGDLIRAIGFLPAKIHEALVEMDEAASGAVAGAIHALSGGLVEDLRRLAERIWEIEPQIRQSLDDLLEPLAAAQLQAELAVEANFQDGEIDIEGELSVILSAHPAALLEALTETLELACGRAQTLSSQIMTRAGARFEEAAAHLELSKVTGATGDFEALLEALDIESLANEFESLVVEVLTKTLELLPTVETELNQAVQRLQELINLFNPGAQLQKFLSVLDVVRQELDVLNPRSIGADLAVVHSVVRKALSAYDPAFLATEISEILNSIADQLKSLDPTALLGDLSFLDDIKSRIEAIVPEQALADVGEALENVGDQLAALDPGDLLDSVDGIGDRIDEAFQQVIEQLSQEIIALLKSLKFSASNSSVSASASA